MEFDISLIAAMSENRVIGVNNSLPWNIPEDMRYFRDITRGKTVIMGRKTFESIGRLLPDRRNIIITRNKDFAYKGAIIVHSLPVALDYCALGEEIMVIGGGEIYKQALPLANKIYLTVVHKQIQGDTEFPVIDVNNEWRQSSSKHHDGDPSFSFKIYERIV